MGYEEQFKNWVEAQPEPKVEGVEADKAAALESVHSQLVDLVSVGRVSQETVNAYRMSIDRANEIKDKMAREKEQEKLLGDMRRLSGQK